MLPLENKRVLVTGGTGSLGRVLVRRLLKAELGQPKQVIVFSRDEAKQHAMRMSYLRRIAATDEIIYNNFHELLSFRVGDIRDYHSLSAALKDVDIVFNAAALKQVPTCEYFPFQAVETNIIGVQNIVRVISEQRIPVETVVGISTDKACKPVSVMGMTKALQERIFIEANLECPDTRFVCVRYGNVLASRGSVIPLFQEQIRNGGPVTVTTPEMTRFLMSLEEAADTIFAALMHAKRGETFVRKMVSARIIDLAEVLIGDRDIKIEFVGVRPGEKMHELLVSEEEIWRTMDRGDHYAIQPILPEVLPRTDFVPALDREYTSADTLITKDELREMLATSGLLMSQDQEEVDLLQ
ncbi:MAG: polysaccharide biosynthesis protein [Chloroflexota bacterium]|nr:MAG: polysaccharide biosynthesis protein [Chloroflexota bacterium]